MCAHDQDGLIKVQCSSDNGGADSCRGAQDKSAQVFFNFSADGADRVYLVGDFNSWSESSPMLRTATGVWQTSIPNSDIRDGDAYKYKVYVNGRSFFVSDPYAIENSGEPYYNSIYRECNSVSDPDLLHNPKINAVNVYAVEADLWAFGDNGEALPYEMLANELLPYLMQMGYTHVSLAHLLGAGIDRVRPSQGGEEGIRTLIRKMHDRRIGVLLTLDHEEHSARSTAKGLVRWLRSLGADGILIDIPRKNDLAFYYELYSNIKQIKREALVVANTSSGDDPIPADIRARECPDFSGDPYSLAAEIEEIMLREGSMITHAGQELGLSSRGAAVNWKMGNDPARALLQRLLSNLNHVDHSSSV